MAACIFCRIAAGELKAKMVFEDPELMSFMDLNPQAPVHLLIVPKPHIPSMLASNVMHMGLLGKMLLRRGTMNATCQPS